MNPLRLSLAAGLAAALSLAGAVQAADKPYRLRCELDFGETGPVTQFYRIDPAAGEILGEPSAHYTREGVVENDPPLSSVAKIELWTDKAIALAVQYMSADGLRTATLQTRIDLRALTVTTNYTVTSPTLATSSTQHSGRCRRVGLEG